MSLATAETRLSGYGHSEYLYSMVCSPILYLYLAICASNWMLNITDMHNEKYFTFEQPHFVVVLHFAANLRDRIGVKTYCVYQIM